MLLQFLGGEKRLDLFGSDASGYWPGIQQQVCPLLPSHTLSTRCASGNYLDCLTLHLFGCFTLLLQVEVAENRRHGERPPRLDSSPELP